MAEIKKIYDLGERTARFGEQVICFAKKIPVNPVTTRIIPQLVAAGTSVGANYGEADDAESSKDFKHWFRMITVAVPELEPEAKILLQEAKELHLIFNAIIHKIRAKAV